MNIENLLKKTISSSQYRAITILGEQFDRLGIRAFLVGGTVRDILLGKSITDIDVVLEADPQDITSKFDPKYKVEVHSVSQFGTCKIILLDQTIDLAMARKEVYPSPGELPVVEHASFEDDLARRDFSINAFAAGINSQDWCELIDFDNGLADLESKQIRVLHSKSFQDDPTRIFRVLRYSGRLGFDIEKRTKKFMIEGLRLISLLSGVRLTNEIRKIFSEENSGAILRSLDQYEVMSYAHESFPNGADLTKRRDLLQSLRIDP
ncbi:MAG: poly-A polymerase, partial [Chloroflexota bacterium]|nr:poly-A polymerase [Chloroflexota bacterium]